MNRLHITWNVQRFKRTVKTNTQLAERHQCIRRREDLSRTVYQWPVVVEDLEHHSLVSDVYVVVDPIALASFDVRTPKTRDDVLGRKRPGDSHWKGLQPDLE